MNNCALVQSSNPAIGAGDEGKRSGIRVAVASDEAGAVGAGTDSEFERMRMGCGVEHYFWLRMTQQSLIFIKLFDDL